MKRFISFISVLVCLAVVLSVAPTAFAAGNSLKLGNNVLTLGVVHNYTAEANGTLELKFHEVYYGRNGGVHEGNLHYWLDFLVNGTPVDKFTTQMEVSAGDMITVQMISLDGDDTYKAQLYLTFTPSTDEEEENTQPQMVVDNVEAQPGEEVMMTVSLVNNPGITNGKISVNYDETALEFVDFNFDATPSEFFAMSRPETASMNFVATSDYDQDGEFFKICLKVKEDAAGGDYQIALNIELLKNNAEEDVVIEAVAGTISVHVCDPEPVAEVPATTTSTGVKAHEKCACGKLYIDGVEVTEEDLIIPMLGQLVVSSVEAQRGEEIVLTVSLVNNPGFTNGNITVTYDEAGLEFVGFNFDETPASFLVLGRPETATMNFATATDYVEDTLFFSIVLKVKDDAADGNYNVGLTVNLLKNNAEEDVGVAVIPGTVTMHTCVAGEPVRENVVEATCTTDGSYDEVVYCTGCGEELSRETVVVEATGHEMGEWYVYRASTGKVKGEKRSDCAHCDYYESETMPYLGDVNGDDKVDTTDAKLIMQYDVGLIGEDDLDLSVADVNGDGAFDTTDAKLIMQLNLDLIPDFPEN